MDPLTLATIGAIGKGVAQAGSAALGIFGAISKARQEKANAEMRAQAEDYNAKMEENYADKIDEASQENAMRNRQKINAAQGEVAASMGKAGIALASGSPLAVMAENQVRMEIEANDQQVNEYQEAMKHREQAKMHRYQAAVHRASGDVAMQGLTGEILGTAFNAAGQAFGTLAGGMNNAAVMSSGVGS